MLVRSIRWCACLLLLLLPVSLRAADDSLPGRKIYLEQCAGCHGPKGDGVEGKYDEALSGDWSLERLIRYIDRNMPEDDPGKCTGEDAVAVGRYIYETFYSAEARRRERPPRVELVHLTNRQYVQSIADLLKSFGGRDNAGTNRGLQATYYHSRDFDGANKMFERVDAQVDFDLGEENPSPDFTFTNGFSMQWRGSIVAPETGEYEFVVRTANGARLWVNDEEEPIIDAWVASGEKSEHRGSLRLIGGRTYPLRLHFFKFKEKTASLSLQWKPPHGAREVVPSRVLTTGRSTPTLVITTAFPADDSSVGYERGVAVSRAWDEATTQGAIETANYVIAHLDRLSRSKRGETNRNSQVENFCGEFVSRAFRRPLTGEQRRLFVQEQFRTANTIEDAVKRVVLLTLKSPRFLYLGLGLPADDGYAVAEKLSYNLWDSLPDKDLLKAAAGGQLTNRAHVARQAGRMLEDARARSKLMYALRHWLQMNRFDDLAKDPTLYPGFTPEIVADLRTSMNLFLENTLWNGAADYRTLLLADYLFVNPRLAQFYALPDVATNDFVKVPVADRSGVVTHPYLLSALAYPRSSSPIHRGVFLTRNIVGRTLKPPPEAVAFNDASFDPHLTMREKVSQLTRSKACQGCHSVINPLGFSLEHYDATGRFRTVERERPVDAASEYQTDDGRTVPLRGARDLALFAIGNAQAQDGFIEQLFHQVVKQPMAAYGPDTRERLRELFVESDFNLKTLLMEIAITGALTEDNS
jgi:hypothetical protein